MSFRPFQPFRAFGGAGAFLDADAAAYIAAVEAALGSGITTTQKSAIGAFFAGEKTGGRWDSIKRLYLPIWGQAAANAICLRSLTTGSFVNNPTASAGYVSAGTNGYMRPDVTAAALGLTVSDGAFGFLRIGAAWNPAEIPMNFGANSTVQRIFLQHQNSGGSANWRVMWGSDAASFTTSGYSAADLDGIGIMTRKTGKSSVYQLSTARGFQTRISATIADSGTMPTMMPSFLSLEGSSPSAAGFGSFFILSGLAALDAEGFAVALKTFWETCTGLSLP